MIALQVLLEGPFDRASFVENLRAFHESLSDVAVELDTVEAEFRAESGTIIWGDHAIRMLVLGRAMPPAAVEHSLAFAHVSDGLKVRGRAHSGHAMLFYEAETDDPLSAYAALAAVAGCMGSGIIAMNETARAAFPIEALAKIGEGSDAWAELLSLPIPLLYAGFLKLEVEDHPGVWMRTVGAAELDLPDLAFHTEGHAAGQETFEIFAILLSYAYQNRDSMRFEVGNTAELGPDLIVRFREPDPSEPFLDSEGQMLVIERVRKDESLSLN